MQNRAAACVIHSHWHSWSKGHWQCSCRWPCSTSRRLADATVSWQVGADLGKPGYLEVVAQATQDIDVQVLFCNAGYMLTGFFENT